MQMQMLNTKPGVQTRSLSGVAARSGTPLITQRVHLRVRSHTGRHAVNVRAEKVCGEANSALACRHHASGCEDIAHVGSSMHVLPLRFYGCFVLFHDGCCARAVCTL